MKGTQWLIVAAGIGLVLMFYFALSIRAPQAEQKDKIRSLNQSTTSLAALKKAALPRLKKEEQASIRALEYELSVAAGTEDSITISKKLSSAWFSLAQPTISGCYAMIVAEKEQSDASWGIAGTTFMLAAKTEDISDKEQSFAINQARMCFENAITIAPEVSDYRVNQAVSFVEFPPQDQPMKGIQQLLSLAKDYPNDAAVFYHLGRFGMQTGQYAKAIKRLEKAVQLEPNRIQAYCLLAEAYQKTGQIDKQQEALAHCEK